jgi:hypothetical protein
MYFKAYIAISTENLWRDPETGEYEGCDPDTFQDHGIVRELTDSTLEGLKNKIKREFFDLEKPIGADIQIFDGAIEIQYQGEHDYRTPKAEQIPFIETARIVISKIEETYLDLANETIFKNVSR